MLTEAIIFKALLFCAPAAHPPQARRVAAAIVPAARRRGLDPLLMAAVACHETGGTLRHAVRHERSGGCSVGPFQVYDPDCLRAQRRYTRLHAAAYRSAYILHLGKMRCRATIGAPWWCRRGWWHCRYNSGSPRWCASVWKLHRRLRRWAAERGGVSQCRY